MKNDKETTAAIVALLLAKKYEKEKKIRVSKTLAGEEIRRRIGVQKSPFFPIECTRI